MLMLHYAPADQVGNIRRVGIAPSRYRTRVSGVYCLPLRQEIPPTMAAVWKSELHHSRYRYGSKNLVKVIFRIADSEPIYWFDDWWMDGLKDFSSRAMLKASEAAEKFVEIRRYSLITFEEWLKRKYPDKYISPYSSFMSQVRNDWRDAQQLGWDPDCYLPEAIIPRRIQPKEIVKIESEIKKKG
jgi:hypothetical protein